MTGPSPSVRLGTGALVLWLLGACGSEPGYAPPTETEVRAAYLRSLRADSIDSPPPRPPAEVAPGDLPHKSAHKVGHEMEYLSDLSGRETRRRMLGTFRRIALGGCEWGSVDAGDAKRVSRPRLEGVAQGYRCDYEVFHDSAERGLVSASGSGYFFHRDGAYDFAEIDQTNWERAKQ